MRRSLSLALSDPKQFQKQALLWADGFDVCAYLDSNSYAEDKYSKFDCLLAVKPRTSIVCKAGNAFQKLENWQNSHQDWSFGFFGYDLKNEVEKLTSENPDGIGLPDLFFFQPETVLTIKGVELTIHSYADPKVIWEDILATEKAPNIVTTESIQLNKRFKKEEFLETIETVRQHIARGDVYEMNLCQELYAEGVDIDTLSTFDKLNSLSKAPFASYFKWYGKYLLSASPERFLKKVGNKLISQPIKGTIKRGKTQEEDEKLRHQLQNDIKERAENVMIVDLVRNDLARSCKPGSVQVKELFGIYGFETVNQMTSTVEGELRDDVNGISALKAAFPMGSMTGAPKVMAMELIEGYERTKRGLYSGSVGYIEPNGDFDFNVIIRSLLYDTKSKYLSLQVGGAITFDSVPEKEYEECLLKASGLTIALGYSLT